MLTLTTLASGSSGNCVLLSGGDTHLLVDVGISARRICRSLVELGVEPSSISGILITHEHSDHISGLVTLIKQLHLPVYTSPGTGRQLCYRIAALEDVLHTYAPGSSFSVGGLTVETFATLHDAAQPMGYAVSDGEKKAAVVTDLGVVTDEVISGVSGASILMVESNHDVEMVRTGPYPYYLKERILGTYGHLSNDAGGALAAQMVSRGTHTVVLAHLSAENNSPSQARETVAQTMTQAGIDAEEDVVLTVAPRSEPGVRYTA